MGKGPQVMERLANTGMSSSMLNDGFDATVVIVRGLPGSGKSTLAREIARNCGYLNVDLDMYFDTETGYVYDRSLLGEAVEWSFRTARDAILAGKKVVVTSVFTRLAHMEEYLGLHDSALVIECLGAFGSTHDVPPEVVERMRSEWEPYVGALQVFEGQHA